MASLKVETGKRKDIRGRRVLAHTASFAGISAEGTTPDAALDKLTEEITRACTYELPSIEKYGPYVVIVYKTIHGWDSTTIRPDTKDGQRHSATCGQHREDMRQSALMSVCQELWQSRDTLPELYHTVMDQLMEDRKADLRSWIKWQTSYAAFIQSGKTPDEAHKLATSGYWDNRAS